jgi:benzoyl-CoA-dihydrodiol lyase
MTWPTSSAPPSEGVRGQKAVDWRLVDAIAKPQQFPADGARARLQAGRQQRPPGQRQGRALTPPGAHAGPPTRCATSTSRSRSTAPAQCHLHREGPAGRAAGRHRRHRGRRRRLVAAADGARTRRRHPAHAHQRAGHRHLAAQDPAATPPPCWPPTPCCWPQGPLAGARNHRPAAPHLGRLDVSSRSLFALIEPGSCFAGTLAELAFCADRAYMLVLPDDAPSRASMTAVTR